MLPKWVEDLTHHGIAYSTIFSFKVSLKTCINRRKFDTLQHLKGRPFDGQKCRMHDVTIGDFIQKALDFLLLLTHEALVVRRVEVSES